MKTALVALMLSASFSAQTTIKKEFVPLQGTWDIVEAMGEKVERGVGGLVFEGENYTGFEFNSVAEQGHVTLDATRKPMQIALLIQTGKDKGKVQLGLIEVSGDKMRIVLNPAGDPRIPLASSKDWVTLKRAKKTP